MRQFATYFKNPTKFGSKPGELSITISGSYTGSVYFTRRYLDVNKNLLWKVSSQIPAALFGKGVLRLPVNDAFPAKSYYIEAVLTDADETIPFPVDVEVIGSDTDGYEFTEQFSTDFNS